VLLRLVWVFVLLAVSAAAWWLWQRRDGKLQGVTRAAPRHGERHLGSATLGVPLGARATFVQFSSDFCQPCRRAAVVLRGLAAELPGVVHVELDAEEHPELTRRFGILRTPTVLLVDVSGEVVGRISGAPTTEQALDALDAVADSTRAAPC